MKLVFFSNFLNHHQLPLCQGLMKLLGEDNFVFVANESSNPTCIALGYDEMNYKYPFVLKAYDSAENQKKAIELARTADVAIIGAFSEIYMKERMKKNLLTFVFTERFFREFGSRKNIIRDIRARFEVFRKYTIYRNNPIYFLCAGNYVHKDLKKCGFPMEKCLKWGYFPEIFKYDETFLSEKKNIGLKRQDVSILCVGRLIGLKHPELAVLLAERLKEDGIDFNLTYVGDGEMKEHLDMMIKERKLGDKVVFTGPKPYREVREYMKQSQIFLFTSDYNEGWGAVLNEAMNSACAVVACNMIGSAPFLIKHGDNGLLFDGSLDDLYIKVKSMCEDPTMRGTLGNNAYYTMIEKWNADNATTSLLRIVNSINEGKIIYINDGPCSRADI